MRVAARTEFSLGGTSRRRRPGRGVGDRRGRFRWRDGRGRRRGSERRQSRFAQRLHDANGHDRRRVRRLAAPEIAGTKRQEGRVQGDHDRDRRRQARRLSEDEAALEQRAGAARRRPAA